MEMNTLKHVWEKDMQLKAQIKQGSEYFVLKRTIIFVNF